MPKPEFESLLDDLIGLQQEQDTMTKALGDDVDDEEIQEAADEADAVEAAESAKGDHAEPDGDEDGKDTDKDGDGELMGKSFMIETESGEQVEAFDATLLIKSLTDKSNATEEFVSKAIGQMTSVIGGQSQMIKSLQAEVVALKNAGRGRKTVVTMNEPAQEMKKSLPTSRDDIMTKCMSAFDSGKISGLDVSRAESYLNNNQPVPADILARIGFEL